jgi:hypothetical protein
MDLIWGFETPSGLIAIFKHALSRTILHPEPFGFW